MAAVAAASAVGAAVAAASAVGAAVAAVVAATMHHLAVLLFPRSCCSTPADENHSATTAAPVATVTTTALAANRQVLRAAYRGYLCSLL